MTNQEAKNILDNTNEELLYTAINNNIADNHDNTFVDRRSKQELNKFIEASLTVLEHVDKVFNK